MSETDAPDQPAGDPGERPPRLPAAPAARDKPVVRVGEAPRPFAVDAAGGKKIEATVQAVAPAERQIEPATEEMVELLRQLPADDSFLLGYVPSYDPDGAPATLEDYDAAFTAWTRDDAPAIDAEEVEMVVGGFLGNKLVDDLGMEWAVSVSEHGAELAVRAAIAGQPDGGSSEAGGPGGEVVSFPFAAVRKRIDRGQHEFVRGVYRAIEKMIREGPPATAARMTEAERRKALRDRDRHAARRKIRRGRAKKRAKKGGKKRRS